ncbi:MAG: transglutaminase-like domain-containing protein [Candidatus Krumholzibacteria bacterium]|jgi:hypothetical protein|nr:transglutaminase-like domain-containing protein [Candidatus Krumholzibacteria bacterium]
MPFRHSVFGGRFIAVLAIAFAGAATVVQPAVALATSFVRTPGDSVFVQVGDHSQWASLVGLVSPDTTFLDIRDDLILASCLDTLVLSPTAGQATVFFARDADTLTAVFRFESATAEHLRRRVARLREYDRFAPGTESRPPLVFAPLWDAASLDELRHTVPLDSIVGRGDDLSRMRNLRQWLHEHVRHDGNRANPSEATVAGNLRVSMKRDLTMNCGGLASTYAALCLAAGLQARQIVCHPFDPDDPDCHSVVIVYSESLAQWVYMDPSFNAEWADEQGRPLDLWMARDRLARGEPVIVNADAGRNGEPREGMEHLAYMAKNLFRFQAWIDGRTAVHLTPLGYEETVGGLPTSGPAGTTTNVTHDPLWFWPVADGGRAVGR